jgi:hypothetical protein
VLIVITVTGRMASRFGAPSLASSVPFATRADYCERMTAIVCRLVIWNPREHADERALVGGWRAKRAFGQVRASSNANKARRCRLVGAALIDAALVGLMSHMARWKIDSATAPLRGMSAISRIRLNC